MTRRLSAGRLAGAVALAALAAGCSDRTARQISDAPIVRDRNNQPLVDLSAVETDSGRGGTRAQPLFPPAGGRRAQTVPLTPVAQAPRAVAQTSRPVVPAVARRPAPSPSVRPATYEPPPPTYRPAVPQAVQVVPSVDTRMLPPPVSQRPASRPHATAPAAGDHIVRQGDTLGGIARANNVSVRSLAARNRLTAPFIMTTGQILRLPDRTAAAPGTAGYHTVQHGDTVYGIARRTGVTLQDLMRQNGIEPPYTITPGQRLVVPGRPAVAPQPVEPFDGIVPLSARIPADSAGPARLPLAPGRQRDKLRLPVAGPVIARFGASPVGGTLDGVVFAAPRGTDILAAENGVVAYAGGGVDGYGNMAMVVHQGGWTTVYAHAERLLVRRGDTVGRGQAVATVGNTGSASAPVLLFELRYGTDPVDPEPYFDRPRQDISMR